jgi:hypothetical protein
MSDGTHDEPDSDPQRPLAAPARSDTTEVGASRSAQINAIEGPSGTATAAQHASVESPGAATRDSAPIDAAADTEAATTPDAAVGGQPSPTDGTPRRPSGTLRGMLLDILEAHPDQQFKVSELCKRIDATHEGSGAAKASAGAVANALNGLAGNGIILRTVDRPATYQLAPKP